VPSYYRGRDGVRLAYRETGAGRPLVLLHGFGGDGTLWDQPAEMFAAQGFRVIRPDFRGHGLSAKPREPVAYPPDVLTDDCLALVEHLGLEDYDLGGYSLGGRIVVRMLVRGATPRRAIVAGQGLREVLGTGGGAGAIFRRLVTAPDKSALPESDRRFERYLEERGDDPVALLHALDSIENTPVEPLKDIATPTLVVLGADDERAASGDELVAVLPDATRKTVPGNHGTAATTPELADEMLAFLTADGPAR
jgi:pimeloyl-ACP methyl ester carboxylesterase